MPINQCRKTFLKAYLLERRGRIDLLLQAVVTSRLRSKRSYSRLTFARKNKESNIKYQNPTPKNQSNLESIKTRLQKIKKINQNPTPKNSIKSIKKSGTCSFLSRAHATFSSLGKKKNLAIAIAIHVSGARFRRRRNPSYMYLNTSLESKQSGYGIRTPGIEIGRSR